jgi:hypothetical protein
MQAQAEPIDQSPLKNQSRGPRPIPNPLGTQTVPQPTPTLARSPDGRFAPEFHPHPRPKKP